MNNILRHILRQVMWCWIIVFVIAGVSYADNKLSDKLQEVFATGSAGMFPVWVYVTDDAIAAQPVVLSERALQRRRRVNPQTNLIDRYDYSVSEHVIDSIRSFGVQIRGVSRWLKAVAVVASSNQVLDLKNLSFVKRLDVIRTFTTSLPPIETFKYQQQPKAVQTRYDYGSSLLQNEFTGAVRLHNAGFSGRGTRIAVFDTGFKTDHAAFDSTTIIATWDFINNDSIVDNPECPEQSSNSQTYHGTMVFSVLAGYLPGELIGSAPGAEYLLAKTEITCDGTEIKREEDNWILAAEWADSAGADIISSSLGYTLFTDSGSYQFSDLDGDTPLITAAADIAASKNILVINAVGNLRQTSWGHIVTPADGDSVIAVGALFADSQLVPFSSPGPTADGRIKPDIASLGVGVIAATAENGLAAVSGTSFATPLVAGCAALALEHDMTLTAEELRTLIKHSGNMADNPNNDFGYGVFDAVRTADIIHLNMPDTVTARVNRLRIVDITTGGRSSVTPVLSAFHLSAGMYFEDIGDGTGRLEIMTTRADTTALQVGVVADVGYFADTAYLVVIPLPETAPLVSIGPNPFAGTLNIIISPDAGRNFHIAIFNIAGEKVWERVNESFVTSDIIVRWDGHNSRGEQVAAGVYIVRIQTDNVTEEVKVLKTG